ncbi:prephenate dehydratase [Trinickia fusca]|uniref:Bifunctional chorismate mutase/prephenate dehydratase n=1 Tax=Trinickia fusca TaxID=2419777 RepID=A0A494XAY7_9BURK|nr:prephenate dehydratase [Trinickia fusca]RKP46801.1 prephenate dehydratase [Trinickia fusca]
MSELALALVLSPDEQIARSRVEISSIDDKLLTLLNLRQDHARRIGEAKRASGACVYQPGREREIVAALGERSTELLSPAHVRTIWSAIFDASRSVQEERVVAFLGPRGTYTEEAMFAHFGCAARALACESVDAVFAAVTGGRARYGVVPVENSTEGTIVRTLDLVLDTTVSVIGDVVLPIAHCLLSKDAGLADITCVAGHAQALAQCRRWLDACLPAAERRAVSSNAHAAQLAAQTPALAAIANRRAADHYGLAVIAPDIQDEQINSTRFWVIAKPRAARQDDERTLLCLELDNRAGALNSVLEPLAERHIAVTRIDSRPLKTELWAYRFFLEVACHPQHADLLDALQVMRDAARSVTVLGSCATQPESRHANHA